MVVTNLPTDQYDASAVLKLYKGQAKVERRFGDFKGPLAVNPLLVKDNRRIAALVFVIYLALLIFCLIERQARKHIELRAARGMAAARSLGRRHALVALFTAAPTPVHADVGRTVAGRLWDSLTGTLTNRIQSSARCCTVISSTARSGPPEMPRPVRG